jgi:murein DD-endopeptidase
MTRNARHRWLLFSMASVWVLQGCSSAPPVYRSPSSGSVPAPQTTAPAVEPFSPVVEISVGTELAMRAMSLLGAPYQWGGAGPTAFDCSGLVRFVHEQLGIAVPRTAAEQFSAARRVKINGLEPGDLLFFKINGARVSHVAIYTGEGRFIHAPQTGRPVELRTLDDQYYRPRLAGAGRLF